MILGFFPDYQLPRRPIVEAAAQIDQARRKHGTSHRNLPLPFQPTTIKELPTAEKRRSPCCWCVAVSV